MKTTAIQSKLAKLLAIEPANIPIVIETLGTTSYDLDGQRLDDDGNWSEFATVTGSRGPSTEQEVEQEGRVTITSLHVFVIPYTAGVTGDMRLKIGSDIYYIEGAPGVAADNISMRLTCTQRNG